MKKKKNKQIRQQINIYWVTDKNMKEWEEISN